MTHARPNAPDPSTRDDPIDAGGDGAMLDDRLYAGEQLLYETTVGDGRVAVTSHRVLAVAPSGDGPRYRAVERPNVTGVDISWRGRSSSAFRAVRASVYAIVLLGAGFTVDLEGMIDPVEPDPGVGIGGLLELVNRLVRWLALLDDGLLALGGLAVIVTLFFAARYAVSLTRYLEIAVDGDEPIRLPISEGGRRAARRLGTALEKASNASTD